MSDRNRYGLALFEQLNKEYQDKPLIPRNLAPVYDPATLAWRAKNRAKQLSTFFPLKGNRILEVGCGGGEV